MTDHYARAAEMLEQSRTPAVGSPLAMAYLAEAQVEATLAVAAALRGPGREPVGADEARAIRDEWRAERARRREVAS